jgi:hypothetical protein
MASSVTDFERYPKHRLETKGKDIQQILDVATDSFGMLYDKDSETFPKLGTKIGNAELLQKGDGENGAAVFFVDQLNPYEELGILDVTLGDNSVLPVAIGKYATDDHIKALFAEVIDTTQLAQVEQPTVRFSYDDLNSTDDFNSIYVAAAKDSTNEASDLHRFEISTTYEAANAADSIANDSIYLTRLIPPAINKNYAAQQRINVIALGDDCTSQDSIPTPIYRISLGLPKLESPVVDSSYTRFHLGKPDEVESNLLPEGYVIETIIKTSKLIYDYDTGELKETGAPEIAEDDNAFIAGLGEAYIAWLEGNLTKDGKAANEAVDSDFDILTVNKKVISNFKTLPAPEIYFNPVSKYATALLGDYPSDVILEDRVFICSIKRAGQSDFSKEIITTDVTAVKTALNIGDTLRVRIAIAPTATDFGNIKFYNDSPYKDYYCTGDESADGMEVFDTQLELSGLIEAEIYEIKSSDWETYGDGVEEITTSQYFGVIETD